MFLVCALVGMLVVPAALAADPRPADFKNAAKYCKAVRESKGVETFQALYGLSFEVQLHARGGECARVRAIER
jgi:hypothetical protein